MAIAFSEREQKILKYREDGLNFKEIGEKLGVCGSRARQLYLNAMDKKDMIESADEIAELVYSHSYDPKYATRIMTCLKREQISTVEQLMQLDEKDIRDIRNLGPKSTQVLLNAQETVRKRKK